VINIQGKLIGIDPKNLPKFTVGVILHWELHPKPFKSTATFFGLTVGSETIRAFV
jgi:hypothetical protein